MENKSKPRICEILGVEVGERFIADYPYKDLGELEIREDGRIICGRGKVRSTALCHMINHPECIHKIPCWTPEEMELAKAIKVVWPEAKEIFYPAGVNFDWVMVYNTDEESIFGCDPTRFPSLKPGEAVQLSGIIGGD